MNIAKDRNDPSKSSFRVNRTGSVTKSNSVVRFESSKLPTRTSSTASAKSGPSVVVPMDPLEFLAEAACRAEKIDDYDPSTNATGVNNASLIGLNGSRPIVPAPLPGCLGMSQPFPSTSVSGASNAVGFSHPNLANYSAGYSNAGQRLDCSNHNYGDEKISSKLVGLATEILTNTNRVSELESQLQEKNKLVGDLQVMLARKDDLVDRLQSELTALNERFAGLQVTSDDSKENVAYENVLNEGEVGSKNQSGSKAGGIMKNFRINKKTSNSTPGNNRHVRKAKTDISRKSWLAGRNGGGGVEDGSGSVGPDIQKGDTIRVSVLNKTHTVKVAEVVGSSVYFEIDGKKKYRKSCYVTLVHRGGTT